MDEQSRGYEQTDRAQIGLLRHLFHGGIAKVPKIVLCCFSSPNDRARGLVLLAKVTLKSKFVSGSYVDHWARKLMTEGLLPNFIFVNHGKRRAAAMGLKEDGKTLHDLYEVSFDAKDDICVTFENEKSKTLFLIKYSN